MNIEYCLSSCLLAFLTPQSGTCSSSQKKKNFFLISSPKLILKLAISSENFITYLLSVPRII